jgi:hypothetical protein
LKTFEGKLEIDMDEQQVKIKLVSPVVEKWFLDLTTSANAKLPFNAIDAHQVNCQFEKMHYAVKAIAGIFSVPDKSTSFRISPEKNLLTLNLATSAR